jgi:hypothetical protein
LELRPEQPVDENSAMLGNCIFRNPSTRDGQFDKGSLCEALLFFGKGHLLIDMATLAAMVQADFLDILVVMLKEGYLTGNYSPQTAVLYTDNKGGIREHFFTVVNLAEISEIRTCEIQNYWKPNSREFAEIKQKQENTIEC